MEISNISLNMLGCSKIMMLMVMDTLLIKKFIKVKMLNYGSFR